MLSINNYRLFLPKFWVIFFEKGKIALTKLRLKRLIVWFDVK